MRKSCLSCCYRRRRKWAFMCWGLHVDHVQFKNKKDRSLNRVFSPGSIKLSGVGGRIGLYLFPRCVQWSCLLCE